MAYDFNSDFQKFMGGATPPSSKVNFSDDFSKFITTSKPVIPTKKKVNTKEPVVIKEEEQGLLGKIGSFFSNIIKSKKEEELKPIKLQSGLKLSLTTPKPQDNALSIAGKPTDQSIQTQLPKVPYGFKIEGPGITQEDIDKQKKNKENLVSPFETGIAAIDLFPSVTQTLADLQIDPLGFKKSPTLTLKDIFKPLGTNPIELNTAKTFINGLKEGLIMEADNFMNMINPKNTASEKAGAGLQLVGGAIFPMGAFFEAVDTIPIVSSVSKLIMLPFQAAISDPSRRVFAYSAANMISNLSKQQREDIVDGLGSVFELAGFMTVGGVIHKVPAKIKSGLENRFGKDGAKVIEERATKLAEEKIQPENKEIKSPQEVRDFVLENKLEETPDGKILLETAKKAEETNQNLLLEATNPRPETVYGDGFVMTNKASSQKVQVSKAMNNYQTALDKYNVKPTTGNLDVVLKARESLVKFEKQEMIKPEAKTTTPLSSEKAVGESGGDVEVGLYDTGKPIISDLTEVGKTKVIGYLPQETLTKNGIQTTNAYNALKSNLEKQGLTVKEFSESNSTVRSGALYAYDKAKLAEVLNKNKALLIKDGLPIEPDAFISQIAKTGFRQEKYPDLYKLIGELYNDKRFPSNFYSSVAQPTTLYRGGKADGAYTSTSKQIAEDYAKQRGGSVQTITLKPNAKIIDYKDIPNAQYKNLNDYNVESIAPKGDVLTFMNKTVEADYTKATQWAKANGYDAVRFPTEGEVRLTNPSVVEPTLSEPKLSPESGKIVEKPKEVLQTRDERQFNSRVYKRLQEEYSQLKGDLAVDAITLKEDARKAVELIAKDKEKAYRVAMNMETSPEVTSTAVNIAMTEKALMEGNNALFSKLIKNRSLAQTRRGQEIVAEKGSINDNSTSRYVKELISARLDKLGNKYLSGIEDAVKKGTPKERAMKNLDKEVAKAKEKINNKDMDIKEAQSLLDKLACKV